MNDMRMIHQRRNLGAAGVRHVVANPSAVPGTAVTWGRSRRDQGKAVMAVARIAVTGAQNTRLPDRTWQRAPKAFERAARVLCRLPSHQRCLALYLLH